MCLQLTFHLQGIPLADRGQDRFALIEGPRGDMNVAEDVVVLRAFVRDDLRYAARADNQDMLFHFGEGAPSLLG